jgi:hypothetical protein
LRFHESSPIDPARVAALVRRRRDVRVTPDNEVSIPVLRIDLPGIVDGVLELLAELGFGVGAAVDMKDKTGRMAEGNVEVRR